MGRHGPMSFELFRRHKLAGVIIRGGGRCAGHSRPGRYPRGGCRTRMAVRVKMSTNEIFQPAGKSAGLWPGQQEYRRIGAGGGGCAWRPGSERLCHIKSCDLFILSETERVTWHIPPPPVNQLNKGLVTWSCAQTLLNVLSMSTRCRTSLRLVGYKASVGASPCLVTLCELFRSDFVSEDSHVKWLC